MKKVLKIIIYIGLFPLIYSNLICQKLPVYQDTGGPNYYGKSMNIVVFGNIPMRDSSNLEYNKKMKFCDNFKYNIFISGLRIDIDTYYKVGFKNIYFNRYNGKTYRQLVRNDSCLFEENIFLSIKIPVYLSNNLIHLDSLDSTLSKVDTPYTISIRKKWIGKNELHIIKNHTK